MGSTLALNGGPRGAGGNGLWAKLGSALPLALLLAGLLLMQRGQVNEQIAAAAEVDTALLSDSLPPAAFSDPGFAEFIRDGEECPDAHDSSRVDAARCPAPLAAGPAAHRGGVACFCAGRRRCLGA
jgi:hypothetical protein